MNKSKTLRILVLVIILVLIGLSLKSYASITASTNIGSIVVSGIEAGVKVSLYQLTTVNYNYDDDRPMADPYSWNENVGNWIQTNYPDYLDPKDFSKAITSNSDEAKAFYSKLAAAIKGGTVSLTATTKTVAGSASYPITDEQLNGTTTFTGCEMGTYLVLIENGYMVYTPSVVNLTPEYDEDSADWSLRNSVTVDIKSTKPQVTKTVTDTTKVKDNFDMNDTISYTIIADKPNYEANSLSTNYKITDKLNNGLNLDKSSIKVYGIKGSNTPVLLNETINYTLTAQGRGEVTGEEATVSGKVEVNFVYSSLVNYDSVKIEYKAKLDRSSATVIGGNGNVSTAVLSYSNNPYDATSVQTQESTNTVYTYGAEITNVDKNDNSKTLTSSKFTISEGSMLLFFVKTAEGTYYQADSTVSGATNELEVDSDGKIRVYGLDNGSYSLVQIKAPNGYYLDNTPKAITITDNNLDGSLDDEIGTSGIFKVLFPNGSGFQLPLTGGTGTVAFVATGIICVGLGILLLCFILKKKKANK